ncbi:hypothetical protein COLO4_35560 [Corchorus olitorius]|uniref:Uncharacterized protein n=1 Tax=Corchorus olitorius TaxID=93759 RepID=A0A1R3GFB1_9ROSI|nr:hypothetical protein COLO4_35560 [Corchorus olitorius]
MALLLLLDKGAADVARGTIRACNLVEIIGA